MKGQTPAHGVAHQDVIFLGLKRDDLTCFGQTERVFPEESPQIDRVDFFAERVSEKIPIMVASDRAVKAVNHGFQNPKSWRAQPRPKAKRSFHGRLGSRIRQPFSSPILRIPGRGFTRVFSRQSSRRGRSARESLYPARPEVIPSSARRRTFSSPLWFFPDQIREDLNGLSPIRREFRSFCGSREPFRSPRPRVRGSLRRE